MSVSRECHCTALAPPSGADSNYTKHHPYAMSRLQIANFPPYVLSFCYHLERQSRFQGTAFTPPTLPSPPQHIFTVIQLFRCLFPFGLCFSGVFAVIRLLFVLYRPLEDFQVLPRTLLLP